jgi:hypothetical protein
MRTLLTILLVWLTTGYAAAADDPPMRWTLAVASDRADGIALVNGVPIHRFVKASSTKQNLSTASLSLAPWLINGRNVIEIRVSKLAPDGEVGTQLIKSEDQLMQGKMERIAAPGSHKFEVDAQTLPRWRFLDAEPLGNDQPALLKAVAALHAAAGKADAKAMMAARKPYFDDLSQIYGPVPPDLEKQLAAELKRGKLQPLSNQLRVTTAHDGKLAIVETPDGEAPIRAEGKDGRMEIGTYWAKLDGKWLMVR